MSAASCELWSLYHCPSYNGVEVVRTLVMPTMQREVQVIMQNINKINNIQQILETNFLTL
jgi:hypothetical protein